MAAKIPSDNISLPAEWRGYAPVLIAAGSISILVSLGLCYMSGSTDGNSSGFKMFCHSYLANYIYCLTFCLGALFFVLLQHLARASWSASIRRVAELLAVTIPLWAVLFAPIVVIVLLTSNADLYGWNGENPINLSVEKQQFLNGGWFTLRTLVYFGIWIAAGSFCFRLSRAQDETGSADLTLTLQRWSGPLIILFALSLNFAAFDWVMSIDYAWFSTIFGVYLFAASNMAFYAISITIFNLLQRNGRVQKFVSVEHFHDMGKFLFGFVFFWGYIAFSQFMLYWYANIPEETLWYKHRMEGGWEYVGILLIAGHFAIPMLGLLSRHVRRSRNALFGWAIYILVIHWVDMTYLVMPNAGALGLMMFFGHLICWIGMVCMFVALLLWRVGDTPLVATRDPWLPDALAYHVL